MAAAQEQFNRGCVFSGCREEQAQIVGHAGRVRRRVVENSPSSLAVDEERVEGVVDAGAGSGGRSDAVGAPDRAEGGAAAGEVAELRQQPVSVDEEGDGARRIAPRVDADGEDRHLRALPADQVERTVQPFGGKRADVLAVR